MGNAGPLQIVENYHKAFSRQAPEWQDMVTEDVKFEGPVAKASNKKEFVEMTQQFLQFHKSMTVLKRLADGDHVSTFFECVLGTPSGKEMTCSIAELAKVRDGKISEFKIYYDPREFAKEFGM